LKPLCIILLLSLAVPLAMSGDKPAQKKEGKDSAKSKEKIYSKPFDAVWTASLRAAAKQFHVTYSDKDSGSFSFETGGTKASYGMLVGALVTKVDDNNTRVSLKVQNKRWQITNWGARERVAKDFFASLDDELKDK
jgi:hypothetical protein